MQYHLWQKRRSGSFSNNDTLSLSEGEQLEIDEHFWRTMMGQHTNLHNSNGRRHRRKLNQSIVDLLPTRIYQDMHSSKTNEKEKQEDAENKSIESNSLTSCVICLDLFEHGNILRILPCYHEYHKQCIGKMGSFFFRKTK
jgi:hypothetical protein